MKPLSTDSIADLKELLRPESLWEQMQGREAHLLGVIERIHQRHEPLTIPYLALVTLDRRTAIGIAALRAIDGLLRTRPPAEVVRLIDLCRFHDPAIGGDRLTTWRRMARWEAERWRSIGPVADAWFAVLSGHSSGYIRQIAVELLAGSQAPFVIPALRLRLNDWVEEVRTTAMTAIGPCLQSEDLASLLSFMPVLEDLRRCGRRDHGPLLTRIRARLRTPAARQHLVDGCAHPDKGVRLWCFMTLADLEPTVPFRLSVLATGDIAMRRHVAKAIAAEALETDPSAYVELLLADRCMPVRRDGLLALVTWAGRAAVDRLRRLSCDRNATVREFARYYLVKWSDASAILSYYRDRLDVATGAELIGIIAGLGEVGEATDASLLAPYRTHHRASVRRAVVLALDRLLPLTDTAQFLDALRDPSPRIRRVVAAALDRRSGQLTVELLLERHFRGDEHEQAGVFTVIGHLGGFDRLGAYLTIVAHRDSGWQLVATEQVRRLCSGTIDGYIRLNASDSALRRIAGILPRIDRELASLVLARVRALTGDDRWPTSGQW